MADRTTRPVIRTPDQRLRVFVSSTLQEAAEERAAARDAIAKLRLAPVMFEMGARPYPPRDLYRAYLDQSHIFVGIYWQKYGWVAPGEEISGLEDEYRLSGDRPKLIYIKSPAPEREPRLKTLLDHIKGEDSASYKYFSTVAELRELIENDLAMVLSERFEQTQAAAPGEAAAPRPLHNLITPRNPLVGRERELTLACDLMLGDQVSLLTLTGPGGSGKSRLGLHIALDLLGHFQDGAFLVRLTPITDPALVASAIAQTLDLRETSGGQTLLDSLTDYLRNKHLLLLLDNFEQVISAAPLVGELLEACPRLKVIVTSRAPLRLRAERELPVPPLALPDIAHLPDVDHLSQYAAVELFIQRASSVKPDFAVTNANAPAVAEICQRLDGLPLAIELSAARIRILSPQALLARLGSRLEVLTGGARDLPARQQTLRSAIAWSYDLLSDRAKTLFRRLAVFAGGWTLEAAEEVCNLGGDLGAEILNELETLVDNNLLKPGEGLGGEPRFRMLETIREYALERLAECGEKEIIRQRHVDFFLQLAETAEPYLISGQPQAWLARLDAELDNLRAALKWSGASEVDAEIGLRIAGALAWFWFFRGRMTEGCRWLEPALARASSTSRTLAHAKGLYSAGALNFAVGDYATAQAQLKASLALSRELGPAGRLGVAYSLTYLGLIGTSQNNNEQACILLNESLDCLRDLNQPWIEAFTRVCLGFARLNLGDHTQARPLFEGSLAQFRALGDVWGISIALNAWGGMALTLGDYAAARSAYEESARLMRREGDRWDLGLALVGLGHAVMRQNDLLQARSLLGESLALWDQLGARSGFVLSFALFAALSVTQRQFARAARLLGVADALSAVGGFALYAADRIEYDRNLATVRAELGEAAFAAAYEEGRAMPLERAIAYAREDEPTL